MIQISVKQFSKKSGGVMVACSTCHGTGMAVDNLFRNNPQGIKANCQRCNGTGQVKLKW